MMTTLAETLHQKTIEVAKHFVEKETELLSCLVALVETEALVELGYTSVWAYCVQELSFSSSRAGYFASVTKKAAVIPELKEALVQGELSANKANLILPVLNPNEDPTPWIEKAKELNQEELQDAVKNENPEPKRRETLRKISATESVLNFTLSAEEREFVVRAKELLAQKTKGAVNYGETFIYLAKQFVEQTDPLKKAERRRTSPPKNKETKEPSAQTRHEVNERDGGQCTYTSGYGKRCQERQWTQMHHIQHRAHGGKHVKENLSTLCFMHHRFIHHPPERQLFNPDEKIDCPR
jgi:HNH endonuclease